MINDKKNENGIKTSAKVFFLLKISLLHKNSYTAA